MADANKWLEAAKRAAIITPALQLCLGLVPLTVVPPQFRVEFLIAQRLVPWLGYGGAFMALSWGAMRSFEKGPRDCESTHLEMDTDYVYCRSGNRVDSELALTRRIYLWDMGSE